MRRFTVLFLCGLLSLSALLLLASEPMHADPSPGSRSYSGGSPTLQRALRAMKGGREKAAVRYAREVVRSASRSNDRKGAYLILCALYRKSGKLEKSLRACDGALRLMRDDDWRILANRAHTLLLIGRAEESLEGFESAVALLEEKRTGPWKVSRVERDATAESLALMNEQMQQARKLLSDAAPPDAEIIANEARAHGPGSLSPTGDSSGSEARETP